MGNPVRPLEGDAITVLVEGAGVPTTHAARAGTVHDTTMFVPRRAGDARWAVDPQSHAVVLFTHGGRLFSWPMRVEEVLPSSYYLVSLRDPGEGERRAFVRAQVPMRVRASRHGGSREPWSQVSADVSASGMRLPSPLDVRPDDLIDLTLRIDGSKGDVTALARVVRCLDGETGPELALEFTQLASADEDRLLQLVFRSREQELFERIGRRDVP